MRRQIGHEELSYLYTQIGRAIWHLQYVENSLVPLIVIKGIAKELNSIEEKVALNHEKKLNKLTLGRLIGKASDLKVIDSSFENRLREFNNERKWIVHNSLFESGDHLYTDQGRNIVFLRIENFIDEAIHLHNFIGELIVEYSVNKGMTRKSINEIAENHISKLKGNDV